MDSVAALRLVELDVTPVTAENFRPYGTLIEVAEDGDVFGPNEAQLDLSRGTPRFYIMNLHHRGTTFRQITRHLQVTQCLAAVGGHPWLLGVAPPIDPDNPQAMPDPNDIRAFEIPGDRAIMLHRGTWHAGPYFTLPTLAFFNLELADTNQVDHHDCHLDQTYHLQMRFKV